MLQPRASDEAEGVRTPSELRSSFNIRSLFSYLGLKETELIPLSSQGQMSLRRDSKRQLKRRERSWRFHFNQVLDRAQAFDLHPPTRSRH